MGLCEKCSNMKTRVRIRGLSDFDRVIGIVRESLKEGVIRHSAYWPEGKVLMEMPPFEKEDWGDFVLYYFECSACNQRFKLSVEMYHGSGGSWQAINQEDDYGNRGQPSSEGIG